MTHKQSAHMEWAFVITFICFLICPMVLNSGQASAQAALSPNSSALQENAIRVFLDGMAGYEEFITLEIPYVNFVRDRKLAQVHILLTTQKTGSGGIEHTLRFMGLEGFEAVNDTLVYQSQQMDTEDTIRRGILNVLRIGLVRYVSKTSLIDYINVDYREPKGLRAPEDVVDRWNYWVFNISGSGRQEGEQTRTNTTLNSSVTADRITPDWKFNFRYTGNDRIQKIKRGDDWYTDYTRTRHVGYWIVKSLGPHWAAGFNMSWDRSSYNNIHNNYNIALPVIEYNVFPYSESTFREFTFLYRVDYNQNYYYEETMYNKTQERLLSEQLSARYVVKDRWGSISAALTGSNYFHDTTKNRLVFSSTLSFRLLAGLSLDVTGSYSRIHDQLGLAKKDLTPEEILLNRKAQATSYSYTTQLGLRYTFGSIYSNVVNPRIY